MNAFPDFGLMKMINALILMSAKSLDVRIVRNALILPVHTIAFVPMALNCHATCPNVSKLKTNVSHSSR